MTTLAMTTLETWFGLAAAGTNVRTELRAGLATFLTMAYIMFVNPAILSQAGVDFGAAFVATCLAAAISTAVMGLYANYPVALAPGMGLNAYFTFVVVPQLGGNWQLALGCVFLSGVLFFLISLSPLREWLINAIPTNLKLGIAAGIGLFLAIIGLENAGLVVDHPATLVTLGDLKAPAALLACLGFVVIAGLAARKVPGAIIIGILAVSVIAMASGLQEFKGIVSLPPSLAPTFLQMDIVGALDVGLVTIVFTFMLVDLLDTSGTLIGVARQAGLLDERGRLPRLRQALLADSTATMLGAALGTSTTTSYIESAAGVQEGGRTGLTAVTVAALFLLGLLFSPLAQGIPAYATAPALVFVACLMVTSLRAIDWDEATEYVPALITAVFMPLTYSIATGIGLGFITYVGVKLASGRWRDVNPAVAVIAAAFLVKIVLG